MNIPFLGKKIKWYNMSDLNETELKKGFFRPNQKFCTDDSQRSNIVVDHLNVTIQHNHILKEVSAVIPDRKITCKEELQEYMEKLDLVGEGGTDFRPAFAYIDELIATHRFTELKGVIYFTDGQGIYPQKMPPYQTAFVFMDDGAEEQEVPPWAMKLVLDEEDLRGVRNR